MGFITYLGFEGLRQSSLQVQYVSIFTSRNIWQYASFPVKNFRTYTSGYGYRTSPIPEET